MRHLAYVNPCCGYVVTVDTDVDNLIDPSTEAVNPKPTDIAICLNCGSTLVYGDDLKTRLATPKELYELAQEDLSNLMKVRAYIKERGPLRKKL